MQISDMARYQEQETLDGCARLSQLSRPAT